jgi:O-antigen/teichoic acid export membrane protein
MAYGSVLLPAITEAVQRNRNEELNVTLSKSYAYIVGLGMPASLGLFVFAPALVILFSGEAFAPAILTLRILSPFPLIIGLGYFWGYQVLLPMGKERSLLKAAVVGMFASVLLNIVLVPRLGQDGAAVAGVVAEVLVTLCYFWTIRKSLPYRPGFKPTGLALLACTPFIAAYFLPTDFLAHSMGITFAVCGAVCAVLYMAIQLLVFRNEALLSLLVKSNHLQKG